jgi:hypothetical protein
MVFNRNDKHQIGLVYYNVKDNRNKPQEFSIKTAEDLKRLVSNQPILLSDVLCRTLSSSQAMSHHIGLLIEANEAMLSAIDERDMISRDLTGFLRFPSYDRQCLE